MSSLWIKWFMFLNTIMCGDINHQLPTINLSSYIIFMGGSVPKTGAKLLNIFQLRKTIQVILCLSIIVFHIVEDSAATLKYGYHVVHLVGTEHCYTGLPEVGNSLENRTCGKVTAGVEDSAVLVDTLNVYAEHLLKDIYLIVKGEPAVAAVLHLTEYPRTSERGTTYHYGIDIIFIELFLGCSIVGYVAVADDWNVNLRVVLDFSVSSRLLRYTSGFGYARGWSVPVCRNPATARQAR